MTLTVQDMIDQVRQQSDEFDTITISDEYILNLLNKAQRIATSTISRRQDSFLLDVHSFTTTSTDVYDLPTDIFARRIESVEYIENGKPYPIKCISQRMAANYRNTNNTAYPDFYFPRGNQIQLVPYPKSGLTVQVWYHKKCDKLVEPQGRITEIDTVNNFIRVDSIGDDVTTDTGSLNAYLSIIDWETGEIKATLQTLSTSATDNKISFKAASPTRPSVLGKTIVTEIPSTVAEDDYICSVYGTCIPQLPEICTDFQILYAVMDVKRRMGEPSQEDYAAMKELEKQLKNINNNRESQLRVRKINSHLSGTQYRNLFKYYNS